MAPGTSSGLPRLPRPTARAPQDLYHLRKLRNRIAHYEPIHQRHLTADHTKLLRILSHISPETTDWVRANDRVPEVLARRADVCAAAVPTRF
ncbi:hypothetical protein ACFOWE_18505 [Planomonospora corallina]|uniref:Abi-like protein n=1 Tax=Planomonospora corallina TaxID=1806052 RepID=A0ABV8I7X9_9ACTN